MAKTEMIRARIEPEAKHVAEEIFRTLGISASEAINMFYRQVALHHGRNNAITRRIVPRRTRSRPIVLKSAPFKLVRLGVAAGAWMGGDD